MTREEAIKVLSESINDCSKVPLDKIVEAVHLSIEALSQPSLPSNLDEAAHSYAWEKQEHHIDFDGDEYLDYGPRYDAFKAGAEWMAGQGVTVECGVRVYPTLDGVAHRWVSLYKNGINIDLLKDIPRLKSLGFKDDDDAIVQIRKK